MDAGGLYLLWDRNGVPRVFPLVYVCAWRLLSAVFCPAGNLDWMEGAALETGALVYGICDSGRIYYRNLCEQNHGVACLGLFGPAIPAFRTDLYSIYDFVFRIMRNWNFSDCVSAPLVLQRDEAGIPRIIKWFSNIRKNDIIYARKLSEVFSELGGHGII